MLGQFFETKVLCQSQRLTGTERTQLLSQGHLFWTSVECARMVSLCMNASKSNPSRLTDYVQLSDIQEASGAVKQPLLFGGHCAPPRTLPKARWLNFHFSVGASGVGEREATELQRGVADKYGSQCGLRICLNDDLLVMAVCCQHGQLRTKHLRSWIRVILGFVS